MRWVAVLGSLCAACAAPRAFDCADDEQCGPGICEAAGYCSVPDGECPSGRRYDTHAGGGLSGQCVDEDGPAITSTTTSGGATTTTTTGPGSTTTVGTTAMGTSAGGSGPVVGTGTDGGDLPLVFFDDFNRADGVALGNGWIEKTPAAFELQGSRVVRPASTTGYPDNVVYRPFGTTPRDLEITVELGVFQSSPAGHPQIHARIQPGDVQTPGAVTDYLLFITNGDQLEITRQEAGVFATADAVPLSAVLDPAARYRLRFSVVGTDPVLLRGFLDVADAAGGWSVHTAVAVDDADPTRIVDDGTVGFSGHVELDHYWYDDYRLFDKSG